MLADLGWASSLARGWGDEHGARAFAQMREIAERLDGAEARFKAMEGELIVRTMRGEYASARQRGDEMLRLAELIGDRTAVASALPPIGAILLQVGGLDAARAIAERGLALGDADEPNLQSVSCCNLLASIHAYSGRFTEARAMSREAVRLGAKSDVAFIHAQAATYAAATSHWLGDASSTRTFATTGETLARDLGFEVLGSLATLYRARCDVQDGRGDDAIAEMRAAFEAYIASGQRIGTSSYGVVVVETYLDAGDVIRANDLLERLAVHVADTGEQAVAHEIHRLQGEARLAAPATPRRTADAVASFERAIAIAAAQGALLFELRATMSLYRAEPKAARAHLARLVSRLGVEDDAPIVQQASTLLSG
jgi:adenylate cyclase